MSELPSGTVTFLFTDVVDSTRLWDMQPNVMRRALAEHDRVLRDIVLAHRGHVVKTTGDGLHAVFESAQDALVAATEMQLAFEPTSGDDAQTLSIRIGVHSGEAESRDGDYFGSAVNRAARVAAVAHGGQILCSGTTAELVREQALEPVHLVDLGRHRLRGLTRPEHVWQIRRSGLREHFPPLPADNEVPGNLPTFLDDFIGRDESIHEITDLLDQGRLVTLVGVGGVGKTRLAVHTAAAIADRFPDGTWFVELGPIGDPTLVPYEIAAVLGVAEKPGRALLDLLVDALSDRHALLVIDNCEHLLDACARVVEQLLAGVDTLRVLATSREGLMIRGEQLWPVPSVTQADAALLFESRAAAVRPRFEITSGNADAVATICARLDGIPLAIELAASRVASMTPDDIAARLDERFRLLTGGNRTALERHQTLRRTVDWSYDLLDAPEQRLFRCLSLFAGSCTLEAVEAVAGDDSMDDLEIADGVNTLAARSLVVVDESGPTARYRMLETLRAYGRELLDADDESDRSRARHAEYYATLAERIDEGVKGPDELEWLERFGAEQDDLRVALRWALDAGRTELALRIVAALAWTWWTQGVISEGDRSISEVMDVAGSIREDLQAGLLADWALFAQQQIDWDTVFVRCREAIALAERAEVPLVRGYGLLGMLESFHGHRDAALELIDRAQAVAAYDAGRWEWGYGLSCSVHALSSLDMHSDAAHLADMLVQGMRAFGNPTRIADALLAHAIAIAPSEPRPACLELAEAADIFWTVGNLPMGGAIASFGVRSALAIGDVALGAAFLRRRIASVRRARNYSVDPFLPLLALHVAAVLHVGGSPAAAAAMLGASDVLMTRSHDLFLLPGAEVLNESEIRDALLTDAHLESYERGRSLSRDEVLTFADASLTAIETG